MSSKEPEITVSPPEHLRESDEIDRKAQNANGTQAGASMIEWCFLTLLVVIVCIVTITQIGTTVSQSFSELAQKGFN